MTPYEQLARRYCALLGEDPDARIEGIPVWRIALADLEAAMNALDTFGFDVRAAFHNLADNGTPNRPPHPGGGPQIRRVA